MMKTANDLRQLLNVIDHRGYPAYKDTKGCYSFESYTLSIDHVQGDPFAAPSRLSVIVKGDAAGFPQGLYETECRRIALQDYLLRLFHQQIQKYNFKAKGSGKSGLLTVSTCGQEILERTACEIRPADGGLLLRFFAGFPANGRTINAGELSRILFDFLPQCVRATLFYKNLDAGKVEAVSFLADDQEALRRQLPERDLTAFVANGSVLPRESGISSRPMKGGIPFRSPSSMEVTLKLPHRGEIRGMGIRRGITLIVGGGYHGKSTLLNALEKGVYNHIAGDGREYVVTDPTALKIRAEDGRSIRKTDISLFVKDLPNGKDTRSFYTEDASGSTSQAANVVEGIESGSGLLLIDEDTCATNFMIRDELMQRVVHRDQEPITPFIERARHLYDAYGISSVIVAGSSGAYFHIADCIVQMDRYEPKEITAAAKKEASSFPPLTFPATCPAEPSFARSPGYNAEIRTDNRLKIKTMGKDAVSLNHETIDLRYLEQLADSEQTAALGYLLAYAEKNLFDGRKTIRQVIDSLYELIRRDGLAGVASGSYLSTDMALPRKQELFSCFNRYRRLKL